MAWSFLTAKHLNFDDKLVISSDTCVVRASSYNRPSRIPCASVCRPAQIVNLLRSAGGEIAPRPDHRPQRARK